MFFSEENPEIFVLENSKNSGNCWKIDKILEIFIFTSCGPNFWQLLDKRWFVFINKRWFAVDLNTGFLINI